MKLIKYDRGKNGSNGTTIINNNNNNSESGGSRGDGGTRGDSDRTIWGQNDAGEDIDGSMVVNGNITIKAIVPPTYEDDDEDDGDDEEEETGGGNLNVELDITARKTEATETYGKKLFLNYPTANDAKTNVADLIKTNANAISKNKTDISNLTTTVNNHTTQISNNATNISNNTTEINNLKNTINNFDGITEDRLNEILNNWKYGAYGRPVILATGKMRKSALSTSTNWYWEGISLDSISSIILSHTDGLMTMEIAPYTNAHNVIYTVHATQMKSGETGNDVTNTSIKGRSDGAHWFETRIDNTVNKVYIREFHQGDQNNDTWVSNYWGGDGDGIKEVAITLIGYAYFTSTTAETASLNDGEIIEETPPENNEENEIN